MNRTYRSMLEDEKPTTEEYYYTDSISITPTQQMMSSCVGAVITSLFVTPLDVVKIRLQAQQKEFMKRKCFLYCNGLMDHVCYCPNGNNNNLKTEWYQRPAHFTGTVDGLVKITRNEGLFSLWSGLPPTLVMAVPATVVYFTMYDQTRQHLNKLLHLPHQPVWVPMVSGALARVVSASVICPFELIRTKMQSKKHTYKEIVEAVRIQVRYEGVRSLWRGWGPTLLRDVPFSGLYWASYESLKQSHRQEHPSVWFSFGAGAVSGSIAAAFTLPFDVIKTHRQIELGELDVIKDKTTLKQRTSSFFRMNEIIKTSGVSALFTGFVPRIVKVAPGCAIMITTYESGKEFFASRNERRMNDNHRAK